MANYTLHIAIAKEYLKKHKKYDEEEFIKGTIYPDTVKNKEFTHFSKTSADCNLMEFLSKYSIEDSYYAGWFLHLIVDIEFYHNYLDWDNRVDKNKELLYQDYDILNKEVIEKYNIILPDEIKDVCKEKEGKLTYIKRKTIYDFIKKIASIDIEKLVSN